MNDKPEGKNNVTWFNGYLTREDREKLHGHKGAESDQKGISEKTKAGIIKEFTGISAPYEPPDALSLFFS